ncbi:MAG TPA: TIGR01777 family oxidoreductase [Terriglobales bacterium]|nr:TIGR01777 family oxidoreductase [Terriglobales bacterium]
MTGASGLVGRALCEALVREGALIRVLSRDPHRARQRVPGARSYHSWQPMERGGARAELVEEARAVVHLASPLVVGGRWDHARRQALYESCVVGTRGLVSSLAQARARPEVLVCASTVAYYAFDPDGVQEAVETEPSGEDFLSRLAVDWESAALHAQEFGVRVVVLRSALVVGPAGAVPRLRLAARFGLGGPIAPGTQRQPWIHLDDEVGLLLLALGDARVTGALNGVAPHAVTSAEFMSTLSTLAEGRGGLGPPRWLLRSRFGAGAVTVTQGRGAVPARALELGYEFRQPRLDGALQNALAA